MSLKSQCARTNGHSSISFDYRLIDIAINVDSIISSSMSGVKSLQSSRHGKHERTPLTSSQMRDLTVSQLTGDLVIE